MFILQVMNNKDFKECDEKFVVTEGYVDGLETCDIPRLIFNKEDDANFYVENSELSLTIHKVKVIDNISDIEVIRYLDIRCAMSSNPILNCEIKMTNNFDIPNQDEINDITICGESVHIKKVVPKGFSLTNSKGKIINACRKIFGYVKDNELYNTYKTSYITITDEEVKNNFLKLFI